MNHSNGSPKSLYTSTIESNTLVMDTSMPVKSIKTVTLLYKTPIKKENIIDFFSNNFKSCVVSNLNRGHITYLKTDITFSTEEEINELFKKFHPKFYIGNQSVKIVLKSNRPNHLSNLPGLKMTAYSYRLEHITDFQLFHYIKKETGGKFFYHSYLPERNEYCFEFLHQLPYAFIGKHHEVDGICFNINFKNGSPNYILKNDHLCLKTVQVTYSSQKYKDNEVVKYMESFGRLDSTETVVLDEKRKLACIKYLNCASLRFFFLIQRVILEEKHGCSINVDQFKIESVKKNQINFLETKIRLEKSLRESNVERCIEVYLPIGVSECDLIEYFRTFGYFNYHKIGNRKFFFFFQRQLPENFLDNKHFVNDVLITRIFDSDVHLFYEDYAKSLRSIMEKKNKKKTSPNSPTKRKNDMKAFNKNLKIRRNILVKTTNSSCFDISEKTNMFNYFGNFFRRGEKESEEFHIYRIKSNFLGVCFFFIIFLLYIILDGDGDFTSKMKFLTYFLGVTNYLVFFAFPHFYYEREKKKLHKKILENKDTFWVMQYNILLNSCIQYLDNYITTKHYDPESLDSRFRKKLLLEEIIKRKPDILTLQETEPIFELKGYGIILNGKSFLPKDIKREKKNSPTGVFGTFVNGKVGILFNPEKFRVLKIGRIQLDQFHNHHKTYRCSQVVLFETKRRRRRFWLVNVHLHHVEEYSLQQGLGLLKKLRELKDYPVIICGDFNSDPCSSVTMAFKKHFRSVFSQMEKNSYTFLTENRRFIDYIFVSKMVEVKKILDLPRRNCEHMLPNRANGSDHVPLMAEIFL